MAKKIMRDIRNNEDNLLSDSTVENFENLSKEETMEVLKQIIDLEEDYEIKGKLIELYDTCFWNYDKTLLLTSIGISYSKLTY